MLTKSDLMYDLPEELIAQKPPEHRGTCRLMVLNRSKRSFTEVPFDSVANYINPNDALVLNNTKVIRARMKGKRDATGGAVEFLLLEEIKPSVWKTMINPSRSCRKGNSFVFDHGLKVKVKEELGMGRAVVQFDSEGNTPDIIQKTGTIPIPPYINRKPDELDNIRYQTVFAEISGAPCASNPITSSTSWITRLGSAFGRSILLMTGRISRSCSNAR